MNATPMTVKIRWSRRGEAQERLAALKRRADRRGIDFDFAIAGPVEAVKEPETGRVIEYGEVTITAPVLAYAGWALAAVVTPLPTESGEVHYLISRAPQGAELPAGWAPTEFRCDHCNTVRRRAETFVVRHEDGRLQQVGRQCLGDFLGTDVSRFLSGLAYARAAVAEVEDMETGGQRAAEILSLHQIIRATAAVVRKDGWLSAGKARELGRGDSTASNVLYWLGSRDQDADRFRRERPVPEGADELAEAVVAFWRDQQEDRGDYAENCRVLALAGVVPGRGVGLAVSMLPVMEMKQGRAREAAAKRANTPPWDKAGRQDLEGTVSRLDWRSDDWGGYCGVTLLMDDGRRVWFRAPAEMQRQMAGKNEGTLVLPERVTQGSRVLVRVTLEPKAEDPTFAFGKRPMFIRQTAPAGTPATDPAKEGQ